MQTKNFRVNKKEFCHITDDYLFITSKKEFTNIPPEHELSEAWGIMSVLNYILFVLLFAYSATSVSYYGMNFFKYPINYGGLFLLFLSFRRIQNGMNSSRTPTIPRKKITSIYLKTPKFSYPRLLVYFEGPEGKILSRRISILYKKEALPVLEEAGLLKKEL